jgi:hypothetical protein
MKERHIPYGWKHCTERAVRNAVPRSRGWAYRWVAVMDTFCCGSTVAQNLCHEFGLDPDEKVRRPK